MKQALIILFLLLIQLNLWGQNVRTISGKVFNKSDGSTLIGAAVRVNKTLQGTITDFDGNFTLNVSVADTNNITLTVSFVGMIDKEIKPGNKNYIVVYLEENVNELKQLVVTSSYGTQKLKEEIVGSITTIGANDIDVEQASESIDKMLDGQIAGVLTEPSSTINGPVKIDIRGQGSLSPMNNAIIGTSMQPLIIIDGVIMGEETGIDNAFFDGTGSFAENFQNPLAQISPDDIETFTVLKDAAAVGIYGADGANGVILITTKKGKRGKINIGFSSQFGFSEAINRIQYLNGEQYTELRNDYLINSGQEGTLFNGINTDWYSLLNKNGTFKRYNLNISGGKNNFTYRSSVNYVNIDEPQAGNHSGQFRMSNNLSYKLKDLSLTLTLNPSFLDKDAPNIYYSYAFPPNISPYNEDGSYSILGVPGRGNPLAAIEQNLNNTKSFALLSSLSANYKLSKSLNIASTFGIDFKNKEQDRYFSGENESGQFNGTFILNGESYPKWGRRVINLRQGTKWNWQTRLAFNRLINETHQIDALAGLELAEDRSEFEYMSGFGFVNPNIINPVSAAIEDDDPATEKDETLEKQT